MAINAGLILAIGAGVSATAAVAGTAITMDNARHAKNMAADKAKQDAAALQKQLDANKPGMSTQGDFDSAQKASIVEQMQRRGRASTLLTDNTGTGALGGS